MTGAIITASRVQHVAITGGGTVDGQGLVWWREVTNGNKFRPLAYVNELALMKQHWMAINASGDKPATSLPLSIKYKPLPSRRFMWMVNLQQSFKTNEEQLGISEKESEDMRGMFMGAASFNSDISKWDVSNVADMNTMFAFATLFNSFIC